MCSAYSILFAGFCVVIHRSGNSIVSIGSLGSNSGSCSCGRRKSAVLVVVMVVVVVIV